jgi:membrane-associated HD superfamily phosphohydrolase
MARRPRDNDDDISLFPFLSIIASVIGVLTMMIATLALAQMDTKDVALINEYESTARQLTEEEAAVAELQKIIDDRIGPDAATLREDLSNNEKELTQLLKELQEVQKQLKEQEKVKVVIPQLDPTQRESVASMQGELKALEEALAQLEKELSEREEASQTRTSILPSGSGVNFTPHFVECAAGSIVMHTVDPPKLIRAANMVNDKDFIKLLETVANGVNDSVVFLIRGDGLAAYNAARKLCTDREIRNGKLPVIGNGRIDLSHFAKKK